MPDPDSPSTAPAAADETGLIAAMAAWDRAMVANDPEAIGAHMADDWTIVGPDGGVNDRAGFLDAVRSGDLTHDVMETHDPAIRFYGSVAVVTSRGVSGGRWRGEPFHLVERVSCVFVRQDGRWRCVLTHLSEIAGDPEV